jgi:hypothetical protein
VLLNIVATNTSGEPINLEATGVITLQRIGLANSLDTIGGYPDRASWEVLWPLGFTDKIVGADPATGVAWELPWVVAPGEGFAVPTSARVWEGALAMDFLVREANFEFGVWGTAGGKGSRVEMSLTLQ